MEELLTTRQIAERLAAEEGRPEQQSLMRVHYLLIHYPERFPHSRLGKSTFIFTRQQAEELLTINREMRNEKKNKRAKKD